MNQYDISILLQCFRQTVKFTSTVTAEFYRRRLQEAILTSDNLWQRWLGGEVVLLLQVAKAPKVWGRMIKVVRKRVEVVVQRRRQTKVIMQSQKRDELRPAVFHHDQAAEVQVVLQAQGVLAVAAAAAVVTLQVVLLAVLVPVEVTGKLLVRNL